MSMQTELSVGEMTMTLNAYSPARWLDSLDVSDLYVTLTPVAQFG